MSEPQTVSILTERLPSWHKHPKKNYNLGRNAALSRGVQGQSWPFKRLVVGVSVICAEV